MHYIFAYRPEMKSPVIVGQTGCMTNARKIAVDHANDCGHAAIKHDESCDWTHYRKEGNGVIKVSVS